MIPRQSLVPGVVYPVIALQVADDPLTGPSGGQPLKPGGLFVRTSVFPLRGIATLGTCSRKSCILGPPPASSEGILYPSLNPPEPLPGSPRHAGCPDIPDGPPRTRWHRPTGRPSARIHASCPPCSW